MKSLWIRLCLPLLAAAPLAQAADGLVAPSVETLWPRWQARITVPATSLSPLSPFSLVDAGNAQHGLRGGALFGDYYFAMPSFGSFRASGGLIGGSLSGLPLSVAGTETGSASPYLGVGFIGAPWRNGLSISADIGLVAEHPASALGVGRAVFGAQTMDNALRELRLSPLLQLGVRYSF